MTFPWSQTQANMGYWILRQGANREEQWDLNTGSLVGLLAEWAEPNRRKLGYAGLGECAPSNFIAGQYVPITGWLIMWNLIYKKCTRGATTAVKLRGTKVWVPTPGRLRPAPGQRPRWVLGAGGVAPSRCAGPEVSLPEKFWKLKC